MSHAGGRAPITAIVTAHRRIDATLATIKRLCECTPEPDEILVHVDGNETECAAAIARAFAGVRVMTSAGIVGPGGGRNLLMREARHAIVSSFDDDAFPIDLDYFSRTLAIFGAFPEAAIVTARVYHADESQEPARQDGRWVADFSGGASSYRKSAFLSTGGYVPVQFAYGMEEVDLAIRLHAAGGRILETPWLRVFHDTDRKRHAEPVVTAATISNIAVLTSLRYPVALWPVGALQCLNRMKWLLMHRRHRGVIAGLVAIPSEIRRYRQYRERLTPQAVWSYLSLRRHPIPARWPLPAEVA